MSILNKSADINVNYAARIARVDEIHPIPDAHSIVKAVLGTDTVVVSKDTKVGDIVVFFPVGACISSKYLRELNLYSEADLNSNYEDYATVVNQLQALMTKPAKDEKDISDIQALDARKKSMVGFFSRKGNVRCIKLRGQVSMGYVAPVTTLEQVWPELRSVLWSKELGNVFDMIGTEQLCWKYIPATKESSPDAEVNNSYKMPWYKRSLRKLKRFDRLIPGFFLPHYDTAHLDRNAHLIDPDDVITETVKVHGTSVILANLPVRRQLNWWERLLKKLGMKVQETEFGEIYSTRRVIQNKYINPFATRANHEPGNEYQAVNAEFIDFLSPGMSVYGEIVGYKPNGKCIQSPKGVDHDYGCECGEHKFMPYRITETNEEGVVKEWSIHEVMDWVNMVREMLPENEKSKIMDMVLVYDGKAGDQYGLYEQVKSNTQRSEYEAELQAFRNSPEYCGFLPKRLESFEEFIKNKWRVTWVAALHNDRAIIGMELPEPLCKNKKAPREGIVVRITGDPEARAWKCKTQAHAMLAQKAQDAGEADPEDLA